MHEENLARARGLQNTYGEATILRSLAGIALAEGRVDDSISLGKENLRLSREVGDPLETGESLCGAASTLTFVGRGETAARLLACYEALCEELGASVPWVTRMNEETLATIRTQLAETVLAEAWEQGRALTVDEAIALALDSLD